MASNAAIQQYVNASADPALAVYANNTQGVPAVSGNTSVYITNVNEYVVNHITSGGAPAGNTTEVQFNFNGTMDGDEGLTYNPTTDSLTVTGNLTAGNVLTNNLKYANGTNWNFDSSYSNSNVFSYLPTYVGDLNPGTVEAQHFIGNGSQLSHLPAANLVGSVPVAAVANSVAGANVTGTVASATVASSANAVAGANVTGTVSSATNATNATFAGTVTTAAQPNITSIGTLSNFTSQGTVNFISASNVSLGAVGNIHITGGTNGQVLTATGTPGVVQWATPSSSTLQDVTTNGATTTVAINITNATTSSGYSSGALKVSGGVGVGGNLNAHGNISTTETVFSGNLASYGPLTVPKFVGRDTGLYYIQGALQNIQETGSADWVAYGDQSDDANGWMDMGFTGTGFNDPAYSITKASDGYIICQGMADVNGSPQGGNLVIATGEKGANADIVFAVGGFSADNEIARIDHDSLTLFVGGHAYGSTIDNPTPLVANLDVNGNAAIGGNASVTGNITGGNVSANSFTANYTLYNNNGISKTDPAANLNIYSAYGIEVTTAGAGMRLEVGPSMFGPGDDVTIIAGNGGDEGAQSSDGGDLILTAGNTGFNAEGQPDPHGGNIQLNAGSGPILGAVLVKSGANTWTFTGGNLTFPDTTVQSTAFTNTKSDKLANAIVWTTAPVSNVSTGTAGQVAYDAGGNLFVCVATDTWSKFTGTTSW